MVASSSSGTTFKLDVVKFAKDVMAEVDGVRSYLPVVGDDSQQADNRPTESRVNAFFRLVGLPMVVSITPENNKDQSATEAAQQVLTPGFDQGEAPGGVVRDSKDAKLPDPITGKETALSDLLRTRERTLLELEKAIGTRDRDNRRVSAFYTPLSLKLDEETKDKDDLRVFKRVSPFVVSYSRIYPGQNELSKPFLTDPENGRPPPDSTPIRRPFIETVARIRAITVEGGNQKQQDYLKDTRARVEQLSPAAASLLPTEASLYEAFVINQMLGAVDQLADVWVNLQRRRERITKDINIVLKPKTSSAKASPFGRQGNLATTTTADVTDNSLLGQRRAALNRSVAVSEAVIGLLPTQDIVSRTGDQVKNVMPNALTNPFVAVLRQPLEQQTRMLADVKSQIDARSRQADQLRLELEMMTGEFSGLSMPDVMFTILALFLISKADLFGLLDDRTLDLMSQDSVLETAFKAAGKSSALKAAGNLQKKVKELYDALDAAIKKRLNRGERTSRNSPAVPDETPDSNTDPEDTASNIEKAQK